MTSVHEINITNWTETGKQVRIDQYTFDLQIKWTDDAGVYHEWSGTPLYPNDLSDMPLLVRRAFADQQVLAKVRVSLGIDEWENYA